LEETKRSNWQHKPTTLQLNSNTGRCLPQIIKLANIPSEAPAKEEKYRQRPMASCCSALTVCSLTVCSMQTTFVASQTLNSSPCPSQACDQIATWQRAMQTPSTLRGSRAQCEVSSVPTCIKEDKMSGTKKRPQSSRTTCTVATFEARCGLQYAFIKGWTELIVARLLNSITWRQTGTLPINLRRNAFASLTLTESCPLEPGLTRLATVAPPQRAVAGSRRRDVGTAS